MAEIQERIKKYKTELGLSLTYVLSGVFAIIWGGMWLYWSIILFSGSSIVGVLFPHKCKQFVSKMLSAFKKNKPKTVLGLVSIVVSIILPPLIYLVMGLFTGKSLRMEMHEHEDHNASSEGDQ